MSAQKSECLVFPKAITFPPFFQQNLVDDNRIIKLLTGTFAAERAFYYQLLKLSHQIENDEEEDCVVSYEMQIKEVIKNFINKKKDEEEGEQLQKDWAMVEYFLQFLRKNQSISFEDYIEHHREIDHAFLNILSNMIQDEQGFETSKEKFAILSQLFGIHISQYCQCIKFEESDVFVYVQNDEELYLAYLNYVDHEDELDSERDNVLSLKDSIQDKKKNLSNSKSKPSKNDTIMNIFGDMLHSSKNQQMVSNSFTHLNGSDRMISPNKKDIDKYQNYSIQEEVNAEQKIVKDNDEPIEPNEQSKTESYQIEKEQTPANKSEIKSQVKKTLSASRQHEEQQIFYRPKQKMIKPEIPSRIQSSKARRKDPLDFEDSGQKGTFYRQFTQTKILNLLPEPHRTKVKMMKNRFIGVHSYKPKQI